jgi:hypothetical protein
MEDNRNSQNVHSLYSSKRSLTIDKFPTNYKMSNNQQVSRVPYNALVANVPSNVPVKIVPPSSSPSPANVAMVGNVAHVPETASGAIVPSNVKLNIVRKNSNSSNRNFSQSMGCSVTPQTGRVNYCRPAPFQGSTGEKYFKVMDAYGSPIAS